MQITFLLSAPLLAIVAAALPGASISASAAGIVPKFNRISATQQFTLVAAKGMYNKGYKGDISGLVVSGARLGPGQLALILVKGSTLGESAGRFYQNGTTVDTSCGVGNNNVLAAGMGKQAFGVGINVVPDNTGSAVDLQTGSGTQGVGIIKHEGSDVANGLPYFIGNGKKDGQFYVGPSANPDLPAAIYWRESGDEASLPDGHADIVLLPQCAGNLDDSTAYTQNMVQAPCFNDAAGIVAMMDGPQDKNNKPVPIVESGDGQLQAPITG